MIARACTDKHTRDFLALAIRLSRDSVASGGGPFGAVVVRGDEIVGRGRNAVTATLDPTAHAEIVAIRDACRTLGRFELRGCTVYSSCEPCPMCLAACYWARVDAVYFAATQDDAAAAGFDDAFLYRELRVDRAERSLAVLPVPASRDAACAAFEDWLAHPDRVKY